MLFFFILSLISLIIGLYRLKGPVNVVYMGFGILVYAAYYATIPSSIFFVLIGLALSPIIPENWKTPIIATGLLMWLIGVAASTRLFKPAWRKWLESEHSDILPLLKSEIEDEGVSNWDKRINTQEELEEWVAEVRRKLALG
ncbi:MAG: hypothetical protein ACE5FZ_09090 [Nitrospiria bacterium]